MGYDPEPRYPVVGGEVETGFGSFAGEVARTRPSVLTVDGPAALDWESFVASVEHELGAAGVTCRTVDARGFFAPWEEIQRRTASAVLPGDPVFSRLFDGFLTGLVDGRRPEAPIPGADVTAGFELLMAQNAEQILGPAGVRTVRPGVIGALDIGGTHVTAARVDLASSSVDPASRCRIALAPDGTREELLGRILGAAAAAASPGISRWGVASAGPFEYERSICLIRGVGKLDALEETISRRGLLARYGADGTMDVKEIADRARSGEIRARHTLESALAPVSVTAAENIDDAPLLGAARHAA